MNARRASILLVALAVAAMLAQILRTSAERLYPRYDEVAYLALARDYAHEGSLAGVVRCHIEGRCKEDSRPPFYELFLAPVVGGEPRDFANIKLVQHGMALLLIAVVLVVAGRVYSPRVGVGTAIAVSLLSYMPEYGARIMHDLLFVAVTFAAVHAIVAWQERGAPFWLAAGALIGVAFLTKGSGHLLFAPLVIASLYHHRWALLRRPVLYFAACGFLATSFFLLWRNVKVFGSPFYNVNANWMWLDRWQEYLVLRLTPEYYKGIGLASYLQKHSIWELLLSIARGFGYNVGITIYTAGIGFSNPVARGVVGFLILVLAGFGIRRRWRAGRRVEVIAVLSTFAVYYPAFSLVSKIANQVNARYTLPYVVLVFPYAVSEVLDRVWPRLRAALATRIPRLDPARACVFALAAILLVRFALAAPAAFARSPRNLYEVEPHWHETSLWFSQNLAPGEVFAMPYQSYYSTWDVPRPDTDPRWIFEYTIPGPKMLGLLQGKVRKMFVDREDRDFAAYQEKFSTDADAHGPLAFLGWPRCFADTGTPSRFLVYCAPGR